MKRVGPGLRVAVVGTGALGSALLQRMAAAGVRSVLLMDPDTLQPHNLPLSPFLQEALASQCDSAVGAKSPHKAALLAAHGWAAYRLPWRALPCDVAAAGWQRLCACDLLCCCTDSALSRVELAFIARMLGKPVLDGAVVGGGVAEGRVTHFSPHSASACYLCGMAAERRADVLGTAASASLGCQMPEEVPAMTGTRASLDLVADTMLAAIRDMAQGSTWEHGSFAVRLFASDPRQVPETVQLSLSPSCPWHDAAPAKLGSLPWESPLRESLPQLYPGHELLLDWPVCTDAVCNACGQRCTPFERVALVRRRLLCPHCSTAALQPLTSVSRIHGMHPLAECSPRQLGQPRRHLYRLLASGNSLMEMNAREQ